MTCRPLWWSVGGYFWLYGTLNSCSFGRVSTEKQNLNILGSKFEIYAQNSAFLRKKKSAHNTKNLGTQATHGRSNYMAEVTLGGTINIQGTKKISRTNLAQLREPATTGCALLLCFAVAVARCGRLRDAARLLLEPHGALDVWCYSNCAHTNRGALCIVPIR